MNTNVGDTSRVLLSTLALVASVSSSGASANVETNASTTRVVFGWQHATDSAMKASDSVAEQFARLSAQWKSDTKVISSGPRRVMHGAYQQIIGLGQPVVPLLLADLPNDWFFALWAITQTDPVPPADRGDIDAMTRAWREWGSAQGLLGQSTH